MPASAIPTRRTTMPKRTTPARNGPCPIGFRGFTEIRLVVCNTAGRGFRGKGEGVFLPRGGGEFGFGYVLVKGVPHRGGGQLLLDLSPIFRGPPLAPVGD